MHLGLSTACLYPMATEESLSRLLGRGFRLFEIFINTASELEEGYYQKELCSRLKQAGALVTSIHPFTSAFENMLLFSNHDVSFIAHEVGYTDCSYFIRCYKKIKGITPKQARKLRT